MESKNLFTFCITSKKNFLNDTNFEMNKINFFKLYKLRN